eukprot:CAMPEP_0184483034 /NCGR_PEP_ID=MMETSP0113_2-20130426/4646_1 /TAXON_ID=91329 /ORGANISM="Norrisiella sphaerica, Strain BC52" /LENGTH=839 /DNA_ID=CAMNT_0026863163 /DNA_START=285 /DNA_END=2804 /DNA_ORIENTATION=+
MARARFKRARLRHVARQFDLLEEREVVFSRKKRVEAKEDFKKKIEAIRRDLMKDKSKNEKHEFLPDSPPPPPTLSRGHTDFRARQMAEDWKDKEAKMRAQEGTKGKSITAKVAPEPSSEAWGWSKKDKKSDVLDLPVTAPQLVKVNSTPGRNLKKEEHLNIDFVTAMMDRFKKNEILDEPTALRVISEAQQVLQKEPSLVNLKLNADGRCTIVGDLHGQLDDLIHIFTLNGLPSRRNMYLFNGDFVDRGKNSCEVVLTLFAFKVLYPESVFLNRGNHEATDINEEMGFCAECTRKYNRDMWNRFSDAFKFLPLATVIEDTVFVVHGGLCWEDISLEDIKKMKRDYLFAPYETNMEDMLWSDPLDVDDDTGLPFKGRGKNEARNDAGCVFGEDIVDRFLQDNKLRCIVRSHECVDAGYEWYFDGKLVTVFSASRYRGKDDNLGSVMLLSKSSEAPLKQTFEENKYFKDYNGGSKSGTLDKLAYRFIQYEADKMQKAKHLNLRYGSLENQILTLMIRHISRCRLQLIGHFDRVSEDKKQGVGKGFITRRQWKDGLNKVLGVNIPFLSFQDMLGVPSYGVDGTYKGPLDYLAFLSRFVPLYRHLKQEVSELDEEKAKEDSETREEKKLNELLGQLIKVADRSGIRNLETLFRYFDYDGDGKLSVKEFQLGLMSLAKVYPDLSFTGQEVEAVTSTLGDDQGVITYGDFIQNITVADKAYGKLVALDNRAEELRDQLDKVPRPGELRKKLSDELKKAETKRDNLDMPSLIRRFSIADVKSSKMRPPELVKAKSVPAGSNLAGSHSKSGSSNNSIKNEGEGGGKPNETQQNYDNREEKSIFDEFN